MENWRKNSRKDIVMVDVDALVPKDHLLRKIENVMDYEWLYARLSPYYCADNGRPGADPVVLIKMVLLQHLYGIPSLRQTYREIQVNIAYRWFLGYSLLDEIPHFATVSYAFCKRFPPEVSEEIFAHILNKALNHRMVDPSMIFIDGTHIKASANKKKFQKEQAAKTAKVYEEQLHKEVAEERRKLGKKDKDDDNSGSSTGGCTVEKTVSKTDPDFVKGTHERQFAYEAHTACDKHGIVLGVEITAGNVSDSVAWDAVYDQVTEKFPEVQFVTMDAGYKTPFWQESLDLVEQLRKTERGKELYAMRKETIERVFADAKEKHAMRYTHHRGLARVSAWVRLKYAAMNLKKIAIWKWNASNFASYIMIFAPFYGKTPVLVS